MTSQQVDSRLYRPRDVGIFDDEAEFIAIRTAPSMPLETQFKDAETVRDFKARVFGDEMRDGKRVSEKTACSIRVIDSAP